MSCIGVGTMLLLGSVNVLSSMGTEDQSAAIVQLLFGGLFLCMGVEGMGERIRDSRHDQ